MTDHYLNLNDGHMRIHYTKQSTSIYVWYFPQCRIFKSSWLGTKKSSKGQFLSPLLTPFSDLIVTVFYESYMLCIKTFMLGCLVAQWNIWTVVNRSQRWLSLDSKTASCSSQTNDIWTNLPWWWLCDLAAFLNTILTLILSILFNYTLK